MITIALFQLFNSLTVIKQDKILLIGDFNFPSINWNNNNNLVDNNLSINSAAYKFVSCLKENYFTLHFPTRARGSQTPHILDLVITNDDFVEDIINLSPLGKSDHSVLHCLCKLDINVVVNISKFNFNKGDYKSFSDFMTEKLYDSFFSDRISVNDSWILLKSISFIWSGIVYSSCC